MNSFSVIAFTVAIMASGIAGLVYMRLDNLEKKLKALGALPGQFSSWPPGKEPPRQD